MKYEYQGSSKMSVENQTVFKKGDTVEVKGKFNHFLFKSVDGKPEKKEKKESKGGN